MTELDPKALETAQIKRLRKRRDELKEAVSRLQISHIKALDERDEARREADETKQAFATLMRRVEELLGEAEEMGAQVAALREVLVSAKELIRVWYCTDEIRRAGEKTRREAFEAYDKTHPEMKRINATLTDTAAAAAQYQLVKEGYVVVSKGSLEYLADCAGLGPLEFAAKYGPDVRPTMPTEIAKLLADAPQAGELEDE